MKRMLKRLTLLAATVVAAASLLAGCSGDDGSNGLPGANGANGATGPAGPAGPVSLTNESCIVCHNASDVASVATMHDFTFDTAGNINTRSKNRLNERNYVVTINSVEATAANLPKITFNVKLSGANFTTANPGFVSRIAIADLVPASTVTTNGTFGSPYFENWAYEAANSTTAGSLVTWDATDAANGNYSVTLPKAFGTASASNSNASDYNAAHVQRVYVRFGTASVGTTSSTITQAVASSLYGVGGAAAVYDIASVPAAGTAAVKVDTQKQFVTIEACRKCHGPQMNGAAHASSYLDTLACVMCHSPLSGTGAKAVYLPKFIHQIHAAIPVEEFPTRIKGRGYEEVTYPQPISDCVVCHTASGRTLGTGNQIDNWKNNPTAEICGSCHTGANFTTGVGHAGGAKANNTCALCHTATDIAGYHNPAPASKDVPEYDVTLAITAPANTTHYVAGETPTVTVTLKNHSDGSAVPETLYTTAKHAAGTTVPGVLSKASLYVYGPRAKAVPVLTKAAVTYNATTGAPTQAQPLFVDATDANITTSVAGFSYKLSPITANMTSGTYLVRFIAQNYGYKSDADYKIDSVSAIKTIQIGAAAVTPKASGNACTDCHGTRNFIGHNARHSVVFDTDVCLSCHDQSGNHANPIHNRVHAIHSASKNGDLLAIDWTEITYPQGMPSYAKIGTITPTFSRYSTGRYAVSTGAPRCITCHTSTSTTWKTVAISENACIGCHADKSGAVDHFKQMGGK
jgi:OmcA/MtrC family decaheme c-type cytochrome